MKWWCFVGSRRCAQLGRLAGQSQMAADVRWANSAKWAPRQARCLWSYEELRCLRDAAAWRRITIPLMLQQRPQRPQRPKRPQRPQRPGNGECSKYSPVSGRGDLVGGYGYGSCRCCFVSLMLQQLLRWSLWDFRLGRHQLIRQSTRTPLLEMCVSSLRCSGSVGIWFKVQRCSCFRNCAVFKTALRPAPVLWQWSTQLSRCIQSKKIEGLPLIQMDSLDWCLIFRQ